MQERWSALACCVLATLLWIGPWILRQDLYYDDAAHHVWWLYQYADPSLFPGDIAVAYFKTSATWGYRAIYWALAPWVDPQVGAEALAALLLLGCCVLAWRTAIHATPSAPQAAGLLALVALAAMLVLSQAKDLLPPIAFQRTFSLPLLMLTCWALVCRRYLWVGGSWLAAALLYPVVLPVQGIAAAVVFLRDLVAERRMPPHWVPNLVMGVVALAIAAAGIPVPPEVGPAYSYTEAMQMPEFGPGGRLRMYEVGGWLANLMSGHRGGFGWTLKSLALIGAATAVAVLLGRARRIPLAAWAMGAAGVLLFVAMRLFPAQLMFALYLPNRHPKWALAVFAISALTAAGIALLARASSAADGTLTDGQRRTVALAAPALVAALLLPTAVHAWQQPVNADLERVYAYLKQLPNDALVAAHPDLGDAIPVRTQHSVLTSTEISMAWMKNYYAVMKPRVEDSLRAAYATRVEDFDAAMARHGVDVFVTGPEPWATGDYVEPFRGLDRELKARGREQGFALREPPADRILFRSGPYYVLRTASCKPAVCRP